MSDFQTIPELADKAYAAQQDLLDAIADEVELRAQRERNDHLTYLHQLALVTAGTLQAIRRDSVEPVTRLADFLVELHPLVAELGYEIVIVRDAAYVVPQ